MHQHQQHQTLTASQRKSWEVGKFVASNTRENVTPWSVTVFDVTAFSVVGLIVEIIEIQKTYNTMHYFANPQTIQTFCTTQTNCIIQTFRAVLRFLRCFIQRVGA